jgi:hypothetical protein
MSRAMTIEDIRKFCAGKLPLLDYGYKRYSAILPRNWDHPSLEVEHLYDTNDNLINGDYDDEN